MVWEIFLSFHLAFLSLKSFFVPTYFSKVASTFFPPPCIFLAGVIQFDSEYNSEVLYERKDKCRAVACRVRRL